MPDNKILYFRLIYFHVFNCALLSTLYFSTLISCRRSLDTFYFYMESVSYRNQYNPPPKKKKKCVHILRQKLYGIFYVHPVLFLLVCLYIILLSSQQMSCDTNKDLMRNVCQDPVVISDNSRLCTRSTIIICSDNISALNTLS